MTHRCMRTVLTVLALTLAAHGCRGRARSGFGDPNSPMAIGASWGILLLLGVTAGMLSAFAGFFLYLMKRSRMALGGDRIDLSGSPRAR